MATNDNEVSIDQTWSVVKSFFFQIINELVLELRQIILDLYNCTDKSFIILRLEHGLPNLDREKNLDPCGLIFIYNNLYCYRP